MTLQFHLVHQNSIRPCVVKHPVNEEKFFLPSLHKLGYSYKDITEFHPNFRNLCFAGWLIGSFTPTVS